MIMMLMTIFCDLFSPGRQRSARASDDLVQDAAVASASPAEEPQQVCVATVLRRRAGQPFPLGDGTGSHRCWRASR